MVSGGLFTGPRRAPIRTFGYVQGAKAKISELTGAEFGDGYDRLIADTYRELAETAGSDADAVVAAFEAPEAHAEAEADFHRAAQLGVLAFPTLLAVDDDQVTVLAHGQATADEVDRRLAPLSTTRTS